MINPGDERPHRPGPGPHWEESYGFDWIDDDGELGGFVRLGLRPADGAAWWWTYLVGTGHPVVAVRDHEVEIPRLPGLEVRASGLWASLMCETPLEHWSIGMEAFGVGLSDPVVRGGGAGDPEWGERVPVGLDLEWEASELAFGRPGARGYDQGGVVHGHVLVGSRRFVVDGIGARYHHWGEMRWWDGADGPSGPGSRSSVRDEHGRWWHGPLDRVRTRSGLLLRASTVRGDLAIESVAHAPVLVPSPGSSRPPEKSRTPEKSRIVAHALCRTAGGGGRGWASVACDVGVP